MQYVAKYGKFTFFILSHNLWAAAQHAYRKARQVTNKHRDPYLYLFDAESGLRLWRSMIDPNADWQIGEPPPKEQHIIEIVAKYGRNQVYNTLHKP